MATKIQKLLYEFEIVGHGDEDGFNDPVRTAFDTNISRVLAREAIQNILDAHETKEDKPAIARFELLEEDIKVIPDVDNLKTTMEACKKHFPKNKDCVEHFESAINILKSKKINILKISDFNTLGLQGEDDDRNGGYYCFLKSVGASGKSGEEGGSFGLGKGSFYAASALNIIYVSSIHNKKECVFQGKLRLVSHRGEDQKVRRGNGSFGCQNEKPVRESDSIPDFFRRTSQGTSIYIPGYKDTADWKTDIIKSVLINFWHALHKGHLEVEVDKLIINKKTLEKCLKQYFNPLDPNTEENQSPLPYYDAFLNGKKHEVDLPTLGNIQLYLINKPHYPKRVACFRKTGMLIQEKRFNCTLPYAGVFICENNKGNSILRKMESPNHDKWEKNSAHSKRNGEPLEEVILADKEYRHFIREKLREMIGSDGKKEMYIGGLEKYLYLPSENDFESELDSGAEGSTVSTKKETSLEVGVDYKDSIVVTAGNAVVSLGKAISDESSPDQEGDESGPGDGDGGGEGDGGNGIHKDGGGQPVIPTGGHLRGRKKMDVRSRSFANLLSSGKIEHLLIIRDGKPKDKCSIVLSAGTDEYFDKVKITGAKDSNGKECEITEANQIEGVVLDQRGEAKIQIEFESNERYSLNAVVYEDK